MTDFIPSAAQQAFYDWVNDDRGHAILSAVAGSGKTTTILNGIAMMRGKVWFGVYNKKMADEIKEKLAARPDLAKRARFEERDARVESSTFHSLGYGIVKGMSYPKKIVLDDKKVQKIVDQIILAKEAVAQQKRDDLHEISGTVVQMVSLAKNRGFVRAEFVKGGLTDMDDIDAWFEMAAHFDIGDTLEDAQLETAIAFARTVLRQSNLDRINIDMDDMVYLPLASRVSLKAWHKFNWVLIDEAQDTNPTRRALAALVLNHGGRLVAVGDPHQAIYGFTGADNDSLGQIRDAFNAVELPLTVSYRCPRAVVEHAQQWVSHIEAHEDAPLGSVERMDYQILLDTLPSIAREDYAETAILCRYNKYLVGLCFKMIRMGLPAKIEGRSIGDNLSKLATRWVTCKTVNGLETKLREYQDREIEKAMKKKQETKADRINDEVETLITLIERARDEKLTRVTDLVEMIEDMFADNVASKGLITLCSAHKSKGLEWNTVYLLGRDEFMPSKFAKQPWQLEQEDNLIYVSVTRAKDALVEVTGVVEEKDPTKGDDE